MLLCRKRVTVSAHCQGPEGGSAKRSKCAHQMLRRWTISNQYATLQENRILSPSASIGNAGLFIFIRTCWSWVRLRSLSVGTSYSVRLRVVECLVFVLTVLNLGGDGVNIANLRCEAVPRNLLLCSLLRSSSGGKLSDSP